MHIEIDWHDKFANLPDFVVFDHPPPRWPEMRDAVWLEREGVHRADLHDGRVAYFYTDGRPIHGFGGARFCGTFVDGRSFEYTGAWSSRAGVVNAYYPESPIVDVICAVPSPGGGNVVRTHSALRAQILIDWWREANPSWGLVWAKTNDGERILLPTRDGQYGIKPGVTRFAELELIARRPHGA